MDNTIKNYIKESNHTDVNDKISQIMKTLEADGLSVEFGKIGIRTTYALIHDASNSIEVVGYTFIKNLKFYQEDIGKLKALQQAMARKHVTEEEEKKDK